MFREKIKQAIGAKGLKIYNIAHDTGINATSISSFLSGKRGMKYEQLETLLDYLGLALVPKSDFSFHSDFMEKQGEERDSKI